MSARCVGTPELSAGPPDIYSKKRTARVAKSNRHGLEATSRTSFPTGGKLDLGTWQRIFFAEFDGQRDKRVIVKVMVKILTASWL